MANPNSEARTKVAILGGGPSALACAYYLTQPPLRGRYDITIYTMGWKLGGKGSSGRRPPYDRIEEHGLHVLFGSYHSFFRTLRECYAELDRPAGHPLRTWRDAFKEHDFGVVEDYEGGQWRPWLLAFPKNAGIPGDRGTALRSRDYLSMAIQGAIELAFGWRALHALEDETPLFASEDRRDDGPDLPVRLAIQALEGLIALSNDVAVALEKRNGLLLRTLRWLRRLTWRALHRISKRNAAAHRFWMGIDFLTAFLSGIVVDGVLLEGGFAKIDHLDFREWLEKHGAHAETLVGPLGRTIYDAAFSYAGGNPKDQKIAAGVAVHILLGFAMYRGSMYFKMQAGMGDTVFAPLYQVLKRRGVKFEFFHKVESLHLAEDRGSVAKVKMRRARLDPRYDEYQPLVDVKGLECWPAEPLLDQLQNGEALRKYDLESYYDQPPDALTESVEIEAGADYDKLVFGIPIGAVGLLCRELVEHDPRWREMVDHVTSVQTLSFQIWAKPDLAALGWKLPSPLLSLYVEPLNTWLDASQVIPQERWPRHLEPGSIHYFTGPQLGPKFAPHPDAQPDFEREQYALAKASALAFIRDGLTGLLPNAVQSAGQPPQVNWNLLVDPENRRGEARFDAQYWRSNCGPSERCTLALPGSIRHRMKAGGTGFHNLVVTGDWIDNGIYAACMEGAFNAGILAARAVSHYPFEIDGLGYEVTRDPLHPHVELPRDDALLDGPLLQWWYWTGQLQSDKGRRFGFEEVFFVGQALGQIVDGVMAQAAVSDVEANRFVDEQREAVGRPPSLPERFELSCAGGSITARGGNGHDQLHLEVGGYALDLNVQQLRPPTVHYEGRRHDYAFGGNTYYYSRERMRAEGTIRTADGEDHRVSGEVWFDRQWGELLPAVLRGWQWFAIQLEGNEQIMLFAFNEYEREWTGSSTDANGKTRVLGPADFQIEILDWWTSPRSHIRYPSGWKVTLPGHELHITPLMNDQEMTGRFWIGPRYWEGACAVDGTSKGSAYVELVGFATDHRKEALSA